MKYVPLLIVVIIALQLWYALRPEQDGRSSLSDASGLRVMLQPHCRLLLPRCRS